MGRNVTEPISRDATTSKQPTGTTPRSPASGKGASAQRQPAARQTSTSQGLHGTTSPSKTPARPSSAGTSRTVTTVSTAKSGSKHVDPTSLTTGASRTPVGSQLAPTRRSAQRGNGSRLQRGESLTQRTVRLAKEFANVSQRDTDLPTVEDYAPAGFKPQLDEDPSSMQNVPRGMNKARGSAVSVSKLSTATQPSTSSVKPYSGSTAATRARSPKLGTGLEHQRQQQQHYRQQQPQQQQQQQQQHALPAGTQQRKTHTNAREQTGFDAEDHGRSLHGTANQPTGRMSKRQAKEAFSGPAHSTTAGTTDVTTKPATGHHVFHEETAEGPNQEPTGRKMKRNAKAVAHAAAHPGAGHQDEKASRSQQLHQPSHYHHQEDQSLSDSMPAPRDAHDAPKPTPAGMQQHQQQQNQGLSPSYQRPTAASSGRVAHATEERKLREHLGQQRKEGVTG